MGTAFWAFSGYSWLSIYPALSSSSSASVNLDVVLKQLEPQQMQMRVLGVKSEERNTHRRAKDTETARDAFTTAFKMNTCWGVEGTSEILGQWVH